MEKILEKLFDIKKIPTKLIFVVWLSSILILFVPAKFLAMLKIDDFLKEYGKYIGISFIVTSAFLIVILMNFLVSDFKNKKFHKETKNKILNELKNLNFHEIVLLREFFIEGKDSIQLPFDNETVVALVNKRVIYQASNNGMSQNYGICFVYSLTTLTRQNLNYQILGLPINPTEQDRNRIFSERPNWAKEKVQYEQLWKSF